MKNRTFIIKTLNNKDSKGQTIIFEGDLGIKNAEAIKNTLQTIKVSSDTVSLHLKNVEKLDITTLQILKAFETNLSDKQKTINIVTELPQEIERLLNNTGFDKI
jgi:anti-anti-sigma regulatory factor